MHSIRVITDTACDGPTNMARDESLLERVGSGDSPPTLRLYQWQPPTISLGYFQPYAEFEKLPPPAGELAAVRRLTGGGAILHDRELTYSLTLPIAHRLLADGPNQMYAMVHDAVIACLALAGVDGSQCGQTDDSTPTRGPFFCFARRHQFDVLVDGRKLAGSAQRRTRHALLQHGSIVLENRYEQQPTAALDRPYEQAVELIGASLLDRLADVTGETFTPGEWTAEELAASQGLAPKYAGDTWLKRA